MPEQIEEPTQTKADITTKLAIINGRAIYLPKPEYIKEAKDLCINGQVKVQVLTDENGNVISAQAISGDNMLRSSAVKAAKNAKFSPTQEIPIKVKGIVVYNFLADKRCIEKGIINNRASYLAKPIFPKGCRCKGVITVRILMDVANGKVVAANAFSGHPLLRASAIAAAKLTRFPFAIIDGDGKPVYVKATLVYKFYPNGTIKF
ncbi:MAG: energy transducer TonB [Acidobacteriota bacterium]|nr:energy transducer TonB [Acidobacteriota bacterium]